MFFDLVKYPEFTLSWGNLPVAQTCRGLFARKIPIDTRGSAYKVSIGTYLSRFRSKAVEIGRWLWCNLQTGDAVANCKNSSFLIIPHRASFARIDEENTIIHPILQSFAKKPTRFLFLPQVWQNI
jgi:hypothetical protein